MGESQQTMTFRKLALFSETSVDGKFLIQITKEGYKDFTS